MRTRILWFVLAAACLTVLAGPAPAQTPSSTSDSTGFWARWFKRSDRAKAEQPHWLTPLATTTPRLEQEFRYDALLSQKTSGGPYTDTYGNTKGLELIPVDNMEIIIAVPSYIVHNTPGVSDGFGDTQLLVKYRVLSENEQHGNYILTLFLSSTFPTAQGSNGQPSAVITPTVAYGKGFGAFDVQGTFGAALPGGDVSTIGRSYTWNNTLQYHIAPKIWPEVELNRTWFSGGPHDGKQQLFVTPGVVVGKLRLTNRVGLTLGAGVQLPVSTFHTVDHNYILSVRFPF